MLRAAAKRDGVDGSGGGDFIGALSELRGGAFEQCVERLRILQHAADGRFARLAFEPHCAAERCGRERAVQTPRRARGGGELQPRGIASGRGCRRMTFHTCGGGAVYFWTTCSTT